MRERKRDGMLSISFIISLFLWLLAISTSRIHTFPPDVFHYAKSLSLFYWMGLTALLAGIFVILHSLGKPGIEGTTPSKIIVVLYVILFALYLNGTRSFVLENIDFKDASNRMWGLDKVIETGHVELRAFYGVRGMWYFSSIVCQIASVGPLVFGKYFPAVYVPIFSLSIFVLARKVVPFSKALLAPIFVLSFAWFREFHIAPQSLGRLTYLLAWTVLFSTIRGEKEVSSAAVFFVALLSLVVTHHSSSIFLILNLLALSLTLSIVAMTNPKHMKGFFRLKRRLAKGYKRQNVYRLLCLSLVTFFLWHIFAASSFTNMVVCVKQAFFNAFFSSSSEGFPSKGIAYDPDYMFVNQVRKVMMADEIVSGILLLVILYRSRREKDYLFVIGAWFVSSFVFSFYPLLIGGEYIERPFSMALFPISLLYVVFFSKLITKTFKGKEKDGTARGVLKYYYHRVLLPLFGLILILSVVITAFVIPVTKFANEPFEYYTSSHLGAWKFTERLVSAETLARYPCKYFPLYVYGADLNLRTALDRNVVWFSEVGYNEYEIYYGNGDKYRDLEDQVSHIYGKIYDCGSSDVYFSDAT